MEKWHSTLHSSCPLLLLLLGLSFVSTLTCNLLVVCLSLSLSIVDHRAVALLEPERVDGLVVIDIAPVNYTEDEPHWKAVRDRIDTLLTVNLQPGMSKRDVDQQLQHAIPDPALRAFCLTNVDLAAGEWKINLPAIASQLDALATFDVEPSSSSSFQYSGDAFFILGGQSRFVRHQHLETIANFFPNHMLTTIRGAGHWVHAEALEDTTALLKRFLDR